MSVAVWDRKERMDSSDKNVFKYVFTKNDAVAEAVLYRYNSFQERTVLCCSTQSGCPIGCTFCGSGNRFVRSLTSDEIVEQVEHAFQDFSLHYTSAIKKLQIMFMSMGEPMLNFRNVEMAIRRIHDEHPSADLLISTSAPRVNYQHLVLLSKEIPKVGLQFSVHESTDAERDKLIPFKHKLTLSEISDVGEWWWQETGRRPFFNYCVHEGNNTQENVDRLKELFSPAIWESTISVICEKNESVAAAHERQRGLVRDFMEKMLKAGFSTRMFDPAGQDDIGGGCGQLWYVQKWMKENPDKVKQSNNRRPPIPQRRPGGSYFGNLFIDNPVTEEEYDLIYYHLQAEVTCGGTSRMVPARECAHCVEALVRMIRDARGQIPRVYANFEKEQEAIP